MFVATIVKDKKSRRIFVRIAESAQRGGNVEVVDVLNGDDRDELMGRAVRFIAEHHLDGVKNA